MGTLQDKSSRRLLTLVCVLISAHFAIAYNTLTTSMVAFYTYKDLTGAGGPFAYRMLPALLWKACVFLLHPLHSRYPGLHLPNLNRPFVSDEDWFVALLTFASMLGTLLVARRMLRRIDERWGFEWMALGMAYAAYFDTMLVLNRNLYYPYDVLSLFFFMLLVCLAFEDRPIAFALVLIPAILNKETAVMAVLLYAGLQFGRWQLPRLAAYVAAVGALALAIRLGQKAYIHHLCSACNEVAQNQLSTNLHQLGNPLFWLSELSVFGYAYIAALLFWRYVSLQVKITVSVLFLLWIAGMSVVGVLREVRIFSELSSVVLLVIALGVHGWLAQRDSLAPRHAGSLPS